MTQVPPWCECPEALEALWALLDSRPEGVGDPLLCEQPGLLAWWVISIRPCRPPRPRPGLEVRGQRMPVLRPWAPRRPSGLEGWGRVSGSSRRAQGRSHWGPWMAAGPPRASLGQTPGGSTAEGQQGWPAEEGRWGLCVPTALGRPRPRPSWGGRRKVLATAPSAALQLGLRRAPPPEGGGEEAVAPLPVAGPRAEDLPGAAAAPAPEARERELGARGGAGRAGGAGPDPHSDPSRQVIGLLDVFTPATSIEDFSEV